MGTPVLEAVAVTASYGKPVLLDFDLAVAPGEVAVLLGLNGAGKSTALRVLSGQMRPSGGRVRLGGGDPWQARTRRLGYFLAESGDPPEHLTAAEFLAFHRDLYDCPGSHAEVVRRCLDRVGLTEQRRRRPGVFSKGMRRRLQLAALLAVDAPVWFLDEPQSGLDPSGCRLARELILEARARQRAVVVATHALADVEPLGDQILVLDRGRVRFRGDRGALRQEVGARSFEVRGGDSDLDAALQAAATAAGAKCRGPHVSLDGLEAYLFRERP